MMSRYGGSRVSNPFGLSRGIDEISLKTFAGAGLFVAPVRYITQAYFMRLSQSSAMMSKYDLDLRP
jgi:hypothetical protein